MIYSNHKLWFRGCFTHKHWWFDGLQMFIVYSTHQLWIFNNIHDIWWQSDDMIVLLCFNMFYSHSSWIIQGFLGRPPSPGASWLRRRGTSLWRRRGGLGWGHGMAMENGHWNSEFSHFWLVVWNMTFVFPYIWNNHSKWLSYFSEELKPPTRFELWFSIVMLV